MNDELKKFLADIPSDETSGSDDPFAHHNPETEEKPEESTEEKETAPATESESKPRNRRERRLEARLQAEREASIELAARLEALSKAKDTRESDDYIASVERIYGTDSPEAREATEIFKKALLDVKEAAKREVLEAIEERNAKEAAAQAQAEEMLDDMLEEIEDEFDVERS